MAIEAEGREITPHASVCEVACAGRSGNRFWFRSWRSRPSRSRPSRLPLALAARRTERQIVERLSGVVDALGGSNFPLTDGVLARMHSLSGARFVAYGSAGQPVAASDPGLAVSAPALRAIPVRSQDRFDSLSDSPTLRVSGQNHFAALIGPRSTTSGAALLD